MQTLRDFEQEVLAAKNTVLVDFATSWCSPCRAVAPILEALSAERRLELFTVDGAEERELAMRLDVRAFPTVIAFRGGREVGRAVGLMPKDKLVRRLALEG